MLPHVGFSRLLHIPDIVLNEAFLEQSMGIAVEQWTSERSSFETNPVKEYCFFSSKNQNFCTTYCTRVHMFCSHVDLDDCKRNRNILGGLTEYHEFLY